MNQNKNCVKIQTMCPDRYTRADLSAYMKFDDCRTVMEKDASRLGGNITVRDDYRSADLWSDCSSYFVCINTWAAIVEDVIGGDEAKDLVGHIAHDGLFATIAEANAIADSIKPSSDAWSGMKIDISALEFNPYYWQRILANAKDLEMLLQALVYARRFGCKWTRTVPSVSSVGKFVDVNSDCRDWGIEMRQATMLELQLNLLPYTTGYVPIVDVATTRVQGPDTVIWRTTPPVKEGGAYITPNRPLSKYILNELRETAQEILNCVPLIDWNTPVPGRINDVLQYGYFSSGKTSEGCATVLEKLRHYAEYFPYYKDINYVIAVPEWQSTVTPPNAPYFDRSPEKVLRKMALTAGWRSLRHNQWVLNPYGVLMLGSTEPWDRDNLEKVVVSLLKGVPKNATSMRIIAEEDAVHGFIGQATNGYVQHILRNDRKVGKIIARYYDQHDQTTNRDAAVSGSTYGVMATIDSSHASDSCCRELMRLICPPDYYNSVIGSASNFCQLESGGKLLQLHTALTSGTGLTFNNESLLFLIIVRTAEKLFQRWVKVGKKREPALNHSLVYGDDLVVDIRIFDLVNQLLEECGFTVNHGKSYGPDTLYRESCGIEAYAGYHFQSVYYSRKGYDLRGTAAEALVGLIEHQHSLYHVSQTASRFLTNLVLDICPEMTSSRAGEVCSDLWASAEWSSVKFTPPHAVIVHEKDKTGTVRSRFSEVELPPEVAAAVTRYGHAIPITKYTTGQFRKGKEGDFDRRLIETYRYVEWLQHTPERELVPCPFLPGGSIEVLPQPMDRKALTGLPIVEWVIS